MIRLPDEVLLSNYCLTRKVSRAAVYNIVHVKKTKEWQKHLLTWNLSFFNIVINWGVTVIQSFCKYKPEQISIDSFPLLKVHICYEIQIYKKHS